MDYQEIIEEAYDLADEIKDKDIRKQVKDVLSDGETLAYNEERWANMIPQDIVNDIFDEITS